jgi:hypothetical protein
MSRQPSVHVDRKVMLGATPALQRRKDRRSMKTLTETESVATLGGGGPLTLGGILLGVFAATVTHAAKDIYDNWGEFKEAVADGWNNV